MSRPPVGEHDTMWPSQYRLGRREFSDTIVITVHIIAIYCPIHASIMSINHATIIASNKLYGFK